MNLLIEEFALRCKEYKLQVDGARVDFDYKKFAELIVRECAGITLDYKNDQHYQGWLDHQAEILKHFGVEE